MPKLRDIPPRRSRNDAIERRSFDTGSIATTRLHRADASRRSVGRRDLSSLAARTRGPITRGPRSSATSRLSPRPRASGVATSSVYCQPRSTSTALRVRQKPAAVRRLRVDTTAPSSSGTRPVRRRADAVRVPVSARTCLATDLVAGSRACLSIHGAGVGARPCLHDLRVGGVPSLSRRFAIGRDDHHRLRPDDAPADTITNRDYSFATALRFLEPHCASRGRIPSARARSSATIAGSGGPLRSR